MKRLLSAIMMTVLAVLAVNGANPRYNNPDNKAYWGLRLGLDIGCPGAFRHGGESDYIHDSGGGVEFAGIYNVPLIANLYLEPGLTVYYNPYYVEGEWVKSFGPDITNIDRRKFGMRIPVVIGYHFDITEKFKIYLFTGPELDAGFVAKERIKGYTYRPYKKWRNLYGRDGEMNRVNLLWGWGVGFSYKKFYFGMKGFYGMVNMLHNPEPGMRLRENHCSFHIGFNY